MTIFDKKIRRWHNFKINKTINSTLTFEQVLLMQQNIRIYNIVFSRNIEENGLFLHLKIYILFWAGIKFIMFPFPTQNIDNKTWIHFKKKIFYTEMLSKWRRGNNYTHTKLSATRPLCCIWSVLHCMFTALCCNPTYATKGQQHSCFGEEGIYWNCNVPLPPSSPLSLCHLQFCWRESQRNSFYFLAGLWKVDFHYDVIYHHHK